MIPGPWFFEKVDFGSSWLVIHYWLQGKERGEWLQSLAYGVFGLGNRQYEHFNKARIIIQFLLRIIIQLLLCVCIRADLVLIV